MSSVARTIHENSERFLPAFVRLNTGSGKLGLYSPLDFHYRDASPVAAPGEADRKSTRLNSSHVKISYAVFCLKKKNKIFGLLGLEDKNILQLCKLLIYAEN